MSSTLKKSRVVHNRELSINSQPSKKVINTTDQILDRSLSIIPYFSGILAEIIFFMLILFLTSSADGISNTFGAACMVTILRRGYSFYFSGKEKARKK